MELTVGVGLDPYGLLVAVEKLPQTGPKETSRAITPEWWFQKCPPGVQSTLPGNP
jgi:hypothetical protein